MTTLRVGHLWSGKRDVHLSFKVVGANGDATLAQDQAKRGNTGKAAELSAGVTIAIK
jgi:hypothetical protein